MSLILELRFDILSWTKIEKLEHNIKLGRIGNITDLVLVNEFIRE